MKIPISQGNSFSVQTYLNMLADKNQSFFLNYILERNYHTNLYNVVGDDELSNIWPELMCLRFDVGIIGFTKVGDKYHVCGLSEIKKSSNGEILSAKGMFYYGDNKVTVNLNDENALFIKLNQWSLPSLVVLYDFLYKKDKLMRAFYTNCLSSNKKVDIRVENPENNEAISVQVNDSLLNPDKVTTFSQRKTMGNRESRDYVIEPLDFGIKSNLDLSKNIDWFTKYNYFLQGREVNIEETKAHVNPNENVVVKDNFIILQNESKKYLDRFVREFNVRYGKNVRLVSLTTLGNEESVGNAPINDISGNNTK